MKTLEFLPFLWLLIFVKACNEEDQSDSFQSDKCNLEDQVPLTLNIAGVGIYNYTESATN